MNIYVKLACDHCSVKMWIVDLMSIPLAMDLHLSLVSLTFVFNSICALPSPALTSLPSSLHVHLSIVPRHIHQAPCHLLLAWPSVHLNHSWGHPHWPASWERLQKKTGVMIQPQSEAWLCLLIAQSIYHGRDCFKFGTLLWSPLYVYKIGLTIPAISILKLEKPSLKARRTKTKASGITTNKTWAF